METGTDVCDARGCESGGGAIRRLGNGCGAGAAETGAICRAKPASGLSAPAHAALLVLEEEQQLGRAREDKSGERVECVACVVHSEDSTERQVTEKIESGGYGFDELAGALLSAAAFRMGKRITLKSVRLASSEDRARWAARRASGARYLAPAPGTGEKQRAALVRAHRQLIVCGTCASLVDLQAARRAAGRDERDALAASDGCSACSRHRRPGRVRLMQLRAARDVLAGSRIIVRRPRVVEGGIVLRRLPPDLAAAHAHAALVLMRARVGGGGARGGDVQPPGGVAAYERPSGRAARGAA